MNEEIIEKKVKSEPGTYILIFKAEKKQRLKIGKLGDLSLKVGYYIYVGSALGPGGLQARLKRHSRKSNNLHWHIDYLKEAIKLIEIWYCYDKKRYEHQWAEILQKYKKIKVPLENFGSSDCNCKAHLFFAISKPNYIDFVNQVKRKINIKETKIFKLKS